MLFPILSFFVVLLLLLFYGLTSCSSSGGPLLILLSACPMRVMCLYSTGGRLCRIFSLLPCQRIKFPPCYMSSTSTGVCRGHNCQKIIHPQINFRGYLEALVNAATKFAPSKVKQAAQMAFVYSSRQTKQYPMLAKAPKHTRRYTPMNIKSSVLKILAQLCFVHAHSAEFMLTLNQHCHLQKLYQHCTRTETSPYLLQL